MAEKKKTAEIVENTESKEKPADVEAFIQRKMKAINEMENKATARYLAERVIGNRKEN